MRGASTCPCAATEASVAQYTHRPCPPIPPIPPSLAPPCQALVVALSKADLVPGGPEAAEKLAADVAAVFAARLSGAGRVPVVLTAAKGGEGLGELMEAAATAYTRWNRR